MNNIIKVVMAILLASIGYVLPANANNIVINSDNFTVKGKKAELLSLSLE